jgi:hypothetical protein
MAAYSISPAAVPWSSPGMHGLAATQNQQIAMKTVSSAGSILSGSVPLWTTATWAVPVIGAAVTAACLALMAIFSRKGGKQKTATTQFAEDTIKVLQDNLTAYMAGPRTKSSQAQALATFDAGEAFLFGADACGSSEMGDPGLRCIFERQRVGTCTQAQADAAHEPLSDCGKYSMARDMRDPIANDTQVVADPTLLEETGQLIDSVTGDLFSTSSTGTSTSGMGWLLLAGLAIVGVFVFGGDGK